MNLKDSRSFRITLFAIVVCIVIAVINIIILPDQVAMQVSTFGQKQNWVPKPLGVLIPVVFGALGMGMVWKGKYPRNGMILACVAPALQIAVFLINWQ